MALIIRTKDGDPGNFKAIGLVYDGELIGTDEAEELLEFYDPSDEERIALAYNSHYANAALVPDDEVDPEEYRERFS
ncbi:hypothetical protein HLRTI_000458 [Halorhabdus tiamatea SARL4B]|uniref:Uncharacterized protein n=1 Tax=Halorhabdus tiamatea SARL4B TaxID=1033806 RepID=F7PLM5_9EURY|nr:hypothetical protein [Halorhabdus tiamatea]ERJ07416.1 hypothetical protein HLRTI_000458 [Halorhabdus tiamatea SARL4B]